MTLNTLQRYTSLLYMLLQREHTNVKLQTARIIRFAHDASGYGLASLLDG